MKIILLSHGHYDHAGAARDLAELSGAKIYVGAEDAAMVMGEDDSSLAEIFGATYTQFFTPDRLLCDGDTVSLGNTEIQCLSTPGHTNGTMSFFFNVTDGKSTYRAGMFGGAGANTLKSGCFDFDGCREAYRESINRLRGEKVDVFIGNHTWNNDTFTKAKTLVETGKNEFIDSELLGKFLDFCEKRLDSVIASEEKQNKDS